MKVKLNAQKLNDLRLDLQNEKRAVYIKDLSGLTSDAIKKLAAEFDFSKDIRVGMCMNMPSAMYDQNFGPYGYEGAFAGQSLACYSLKDLAFVLEAMENIESHILPEWSEKEKAVYLWGVLASNFEHKAYRTRGDVGFFKHKHGVCTDFSKALNNLLARQGIESYSFACDTHAFNMAKIDGKFYPIDADVSAKNNLANGFGRKGYFSLPGLVDIFEYVNADEASLNQYYFEDSEVFGILDKVLPSYNKKRLALVSANAEEQI